MTIAALPMYDFPELRWATDALWAAIAARVPGAPTYLERARQLQDIWTDPDLLLAQTCGYPFVTSLSGKVALVATPRYRAQGCEGFLYRSALVVRVEDGAARLEDLRGRRCAVNSVDSQSGMNALRAEIAKLAEGTAPFFADVAITGGHAASVSAVARGDADVAAIDCVTWAHLQRFRPDETRRLRVLGWTAPTPGLPLVTSISTNVAIRRILLRALHEVALAPDLAAVRGELLLDGFDVPPADVYQAILQAESGDHLLQACGSQHP
jgi:ABC-type phosphate/phosphonate transport system substrate-binding protein